MTTEFNNTQATREGWGIFHCADAAPHHQYQLQRDDESEVFAEDGDVWKFVATRAHEGSAYHLATMVWLHENSVEEYAAICRVAGFALSTFGA